MSQKSELKNLIEKHVFIKNKDQQIDFKTDPEAWIFDFRQLLMNGKAANIISDIFYSEFKDSDPSSFQLCALEIAGVPLATSIMTKFFYKGHEDINAFFIRKSRKKTGLHRMIEGQIQDNKKIILVDDIMNSGDSFWRQIETLESLGHKVDTVWSIIRYRDESFYKRFHNRGITIRSVFELNDFAQSLGGNIRNLVPPLKNIPIMPFTIAWFFKSENPSLGWVVNKSQPVLDDTKIYFGSDNKTFWALNQRDGSVAWNFKVGLDKGKAIFSNPALYRDTVIFGAYDGSVYCLDKATGKTRWVSLEADWVGSSPAVAYDLGIVFIGLEYGLFSKQGGIIALDAITGAPIWIDRTHKALTHCSPKYIQAHQQVVMGSNDGVVRLYHARTGALHWKFTTFGSANFDTTNDYSGYSKGDVKESFVYDQTHDYIIFGAVDGFLYILTRDTGHLVHHFKCASAIFSTPYIYNNRVYFTATDKRLRCIDLNSRSLVFEKNLDNTRIFSSPTVLNGKLYVGTNAGKLHELHPDTGASLGYFQAIERITNTLTYNPKTDTYFLPTFANEIIALKRFDDQK